MSRSAYAIASTAVGDLLAVQKSFENTKAVLELLMKRLPKDSDAFAIAELGMMDVKEWESKVVDWCVMMDDELEEPALEAEHNAYAIQAHRRALLKHHNTTSVS